MLNAFQSSPQKRDGLQDVSFTQFVSITKTEKNLKTDNVKTHSRLSSRQHDLRFNHRTPKIHLSRYRTIQRIRLSIVVDSIVGTFYKQP